MAPHLIQLAILLPFQKQASKSAENTPEPPPAVDVSLSNFIGGVAEENSTIDGGRFPLRILSPSERACLTIMNVSKVSQHNQGKYAFRRWSMNTVRITNARNAFELRVCRLKHTIHTALLLNVSRAWRTWYMNVCSHGSRGNISPPHHQSWVKLCMCVSTLFLTAFDFHKFCLTGSRVKKKLFENVRVRHFFRR